MRSEASPFTLRRVVSFLAIAAIVLIDQASKAWILYGVKLQEVGRIEVAPIFNLTFTWNRGVSFGLMRAGSPLQRWGLILMAALIACLFAAWLWRTQRKVACAGLALIVGGAVGNLIDRARYGAVVDFLDFSALHFPWIFNVADAAITVGAALLALDFLLEAREDRARKAGETSGAPSVDPNEERA